MVTVHIWNFIGKDIAWGHASMHCDYTYISWWPETQGRIPSKVHQNIYSVSPIRNQTFENDKLYEGDGRYIKEPDCNIRIIGLDENAINQWWASFGLVRSGQLLQGPLQPWTSLKQNCSTVVANALTIGGGDKYSSWLNNWNVVWTPNKVKEYALDIERNIRRS
jgi:hypothetical protein